MSKLTRSNLQEFCRTCLKSLQPIKATSLIDGDSSLGYNIFLVPSLAKLMILFTSLEMTEDKGEEYPKSLCQPCYYKMLDFQKFRELAVRSAEELYRIVHSVTSSEGKGNIIEQMPVAEQRRVKEEDNNADNDMNANNSIQKARSLLDAQIKTESIEVDESETQPLTNDNNSECNNLTEDDINKNNDDEDEDEEEEADDEEDNMYYDKMDLVDDVYDTIGDDADDEEHALRSGAANNSTNSLLLLSNSTLPNSVSSVRQHSKRDRSKKSLKCPRCDKQAYKQVYLDAHIRGVHEGHEKPFVCVECEKAFTRYNQLNVHLQANHFLQVKYACEFDGCDASFKMKKTLDTHRKVVHLLNNAPFSLDLEQIIQLHQDQLTREIDVDHICQQCCRKYSSKRALLEHLKRHAQIKEHICSVCGVAKVTSTELKTHMRTHKPNSEKFKCTICPQEFNHKNAISRHVRVVHEGQRRFPCSFCSKRFGTRNAQVCHERRHTGERPFTCEQCNKGFAQLEGLKSHLKNHDTKIRNHVCSFCSQRFITKRNLADHEKRHREDNSHICDLCSRGFFRRSELTLHRKLHVEGDVIDETTTDRGIENHSVMEEDNGTDGSSQSSD